MRRIVLDASVVVAGLRTQRGARNAVLRLVATRRLVALATPPLFLEYEDVLKRPEHRLAHGLAPEAIEEFLAELAALIEPVEVPPPPVIDFQLVRSVHGSFTFIFSGGRSPGTRMTRWCSRPRSMAVRMRS
jgi:predicted nucleic acid-binding protein